MSFKEVVKAIREKGKLKQSELAEQVGVHRQVISQYETGYQKRPALRVAIKMIALAQRLGIVVTMNDIY